MLVLLYVSRRDHMDYHIKVSKFVPIYTCPLKSIRAYTRFSELKKNALKWNSFISKGVIVFESSSLLSNKMKYNLNFKFFQMYLIITVLFIFLLLIIVSCLTAHLKSSL